MNFSGMAPGLSSVPGGVMEGTGEIQKLQMNDLQLKDQQAKQVGMQAYFRALQSMGVPMPGNGPQPPNPGQPSMPGPQMQGAPPQQQVMGPGGPAQPNQQGAYPANAVMMGGPQGAPMPQGTPQQAPGGPPPQMAGGPGGPGGAPPGQQQPMTWQQVAQAIKQQNPGVDDLALAHAVDKFMPLMTQQSQQEWRQQRMELQYELGRMRDETSRDNARTRADVEQLRERGRGERFERAEDRRDDSLTQRDEQFRAREDRLERGLKLRGDTSWARLQQQKEQAQARIAQGDKRQAVTEYRAALDAQHKRAIEIIQSSNINTQMKPAERDKFIKEQNEWYQGEIQKLQRLATQRGNVTDAAAEPPRAAEPPPAAAAPTEPAAAPAGGVPLPKAFQGDPDGSTYQKDGKTYTKRGDQLVIENGR